MAEHNSHDTSELQADGILSRLGLTARLILALSISAAIIFGVVFSLNYTFTSNMLERQLMAHAQDVVNAAVQSIDDEVRQVVVDQANLVEQLESPRTLTLEQIHDLLRKYVTSNQEVFGSTVAFESGKSPAGAGYFAPYYFKRPNGSVAFTDLATPAYNYPSKDWYTAPREMHAPVWSEPYFDEGGGNVAMTTYSAPFYRTQNGNRRFTGILTTDISVDWLGRQVSSLQLDRNGYAVLFSRRGTYIAHPDRTLVLKETIFTIADKVKSPILKDIGNAIARQEHGFKKGKNIHGQESWFYYAPVPATGWSLAVVFPAHEMMVDVRHASQVIAIVCAGGFLLLVLSIILVARSVTRPVIALTGVARRIAGGDLETEFPPVRIGGEVGELAAAFRRMQGDLKEHIIRLTDTTAAKERMASELNIAHDLQMSILPAQLPSPSGIVCAGTCRPAREMGGDFYDAIMLDDNRLFFVIGDVSGKGVPAALYMAITVSLMRAFADENPDPAVILGHINRELARDNDSCMFVTIFCGIMDISAGDFIYANAGHNPPVIIKRDGRASFMQIKPGLVAGCMSDYPFHSASCTLEAGDTLLLYTDGVTEAVDRDGGFFGDERLLESLSTKAGTVHAILNDMDATLDRFSEGALQADDITMLAIGYRV